jgi:hypothetical protein
VKIGKFKLGWGHRYVDMSIAVLGVVVAVLVWFIPNINADPEVQQFYKHQRELKEHRLKVEAAEARIKKEEEELGIVWVPTPQPKAPAASPDKSPAPAQGKAPAKAPAKPEPKAN